MRVGLFGGGQQKWPSLNRTYVSYVQALSERYELVELEAADAAALESDVLVNFSGGLGWSLLSADERPPIVFALHGGAVLDTEFVRQHLPLLRTGDSFIGNCESDRAVIEAICIGPSPPTHVLKLPVAAQGRNPGVREAARGSLGIQADEGVAVIVSRLVPQKNVHSALRAVKNALESGSRLSWKVLLVGTFWTDYPVLRTSGVAYADWLRDEVIRLGMAKNLILFPGNLSDEKLRAVYSAADVALSFSHSIDENFGYFALEAMGFGVPVIGTAYGGQKDSIVSGVSGWPLPTWYTPNGLRTAYGDARCLLMELDREELEGMGNSAMSFVKSGYGFQGFGDALVRICEQAVAERGREPDAGARPFTRTRAVISEEKTIRFETDSLAEYAFAIRRYVSTEAPAVATDDVLRAYAALAKTAETYAALDPAWPATFEVDATQRSLLDEVVREGSIVAHAETSQSLARLVKAGILVPDRVAC